MAVGSGASTVLLENPVGLCGCLVVSNVVLEIARLDDDTEEAEDGAIELDVAKEVDSGKMDDATEGTLTVEGMGTSCDDTMEADDDSREAEVDREAEDD